MQRGSAARHLISSFLTQPRAAFAEESKTASFEIPNAKGCATRVAANLDRIEQFASSVQVLNCDAATAQLYGNIRDALRSKGRPIPENDIWIAAVALQHGLPLATRDDHFKEVDGLRVENW